MGLHIRDAFLSICRILDLHGLEYAFIGALPVLAWGRVRATTDIDLVAALNTEQLAGLGRDLDAAGFSPGRSVGPTDADDSTPDIAVYWYGKDTPVRLDLFIAKTEFERDVIRTVRHAEVLGLSVRLASPEASIIYKLLAGRRRDIDDIESIFEARQAAGDGLDWKFLDHWADVWDLTEGLSPYRSRYQPGSAADRM